VQKYVPNYEDLEKSRISTMVGFGHYTNYNKTMKNTIFIDAGILKTRPWQEMKMIERKIFQKQYFFQKGKFYLFYYLYCDIFIFLVMLFFIFIFYFVIIFLFFRFSDRFQQRADGHYCIRKNISDYEEGIDGIRISPPENLICLPDSKGRSGKTNETISSDSLEILVKFYNESLSESLDDRLGRKFSWIGQYNLSGGRNN